MYNTDTPARAELPSSRQLLRSTFIAAASAAVLLITVVLPAEYGIDPTGVGRVLRLTEMGEIKTRLAAEAAADVAVDDRSGGARAVDPQAGRASGLQTEGAGAAAPATAPASAQDEAPRQDEHRFTLAPGQGIEIKLVMKEGAQARYTWIVTGGVVNYDTHGDGSGRSISYQKGRSIAQDEGVLTTAFTGNHGWFWRNRGQANVDVILRTSGEYSDLKRVQ